MVGFDKWCRILSGLTSAKIAAAISTDAARYTEAEIDGWRAGEGIFEPLTTLQPLRPVLMALWPPATAEQAWQELLAVIAACVPVSQAPAPRVIPTPIPIRQTAPRPKAAAPPPGDPVLQANQAEIDRILEQLAQAVTAADQVQSGWFSRTTEKFKKYISNRDFKHRKAYLDHCLKRADTSLEKIRARRTALADCLAALGSALSAFDTMQTQCTERMERKRDENAALWKELKTASPRVTLARQALTKATTKTLAGIEDSQRRAEATAADWKVKYDAITEPGQITFYWLTADSKLGQRLQQVWQKERVQTSSGWAWAEQFDPFEGSCICRDKLADSYKVGASHRQEKPVEIDLCAEIDLTLVSLAMRQSAAQAICSQQ